MKRTIKIKFSGPGDNCGYPGRKVGEALEVSKTEAKRLVRAGYAVFATKPDARRAGGSEDRTATGHEGW